MENVNFVRFLIFVCYFRYFVVREGCFWRFKASIGYFRPRSPLRYRFFFKISIPDLIHAQNYDFLANKKTEMSRPGEVGWAKKQKCRAPAKLGGAAPPPKPPLRSGGRGFAPPPRPPSALPPRPPILNFWGEGLSPSPQIPHPEVYEGLRPSNSPGLHDGKSV